MNRKVCTNKNQCCDEDRCYCDETELVPLEHEEMKMLAQILREQLRTFEDHPGRFRSYGNNTAVREKLSALLKKLK